MIKDLRQGSLQKIVMNRHIKSVQCNSEREILDQKIKVEKNCHIISINYVNINVTLYVN